MKNPKSANLLQSLLLISLLAATACRPVETHFEVVSFRDRTHPEILTQRFEPGSFCRNMGQVYEIALELPETHYETEAPFDEDNPAGKPDSIPTPDPSSAQPVLTAQIIKIDVFWRPLPGTTYAESTQTNAAIRYLLRTGKEAISYEGAGFVYFELSRDGKSLEGKIESSTLRPMRQSAENLDIFGPCRLTGTFTATKNRRGVATTIQKIHRWLGPSEPPPLHRSAAIPTPG